VSDPTGADSSDSGRRVSVHTDAKGKKWLGDVPYDVFFDDPLSVAAEGKGKASSTESPARESTPKTSSGGATSTIPPTSSHESAAVDPKKRASDRADNDWKRLVDIDVLDAETKRIRNDLTAQLQSISKYNGHYKEIAVSGATLAAVAGIVAEHPDAASWKKDAAIVGVLGAQIHDASKALGSPAYQATKTPYEQLIDVLDGNVPAGIKPPEARRAFAQVANRGGLMQRMDRSFQWLKKSVSTGAQLKKEGTRALHESEMLAALSRVIGVGHYDSGEDAKYQGHSDELRKAAESIVAAVKSDDANAFGNAMTRVQKRCDACHADFRFE